MTTVPGPIRRVWRDRPRLIAVGLLAVTALAASSLQSTAAVVLQQTLDENWRGTYDILVTQRGKDPVTAGLLRSDALVDAATGRLSMADLALIRSLPGVEVAAPIGEVSFAEASLLGEPLLWLPVPVSPDASLENPQAFRITVSSTMDDGVTPRELATQSLLAFAYQPSYSQIVFDSSGSPLIGPDGKTVYATTDLADSPRLLSGDARLTFTSGGYDAASGTIALGLIVAPRPAATIALVDPVAERALLGDAGAFLDPLIEGAEGERQPLVVLDRRPPEVRVTVTVEQYDEVTPGAAGSEAVERAQQFGVLQNGQIAPTIAENATTTVVGSYDANVSGELSPYEQEEVLLGGISEQLVEQTRAAELQPTGAAPRSILGARYTVPDDAADAGGVTMSPRGYVRYGQFAEAPLSNGAPTGSVTEYSKLFGSVGTVSSLDSPLPERVQVVGSFSAEQLRAVTGEAGFMPLGGYDILPPSLDGTPLATSATGFGIPGTNELAVGSFAILDGFSVDRPISAIRIRVAGIDAYTPEAQQRLLTAASGLEQLGFEATIVAGSSPQPVAVAVQDYALAETDDSGNQVIADLGTIEQHWSRLGAVTEADAAVSAVSVALLAVSVVAVGVLLSVVQLASIPNRRGQAGILRQLGWRRRRIAGWFLAEEAVALALVAVAGVLAIAIASVPAVTTVSVGVAVALVVATSLVAVVAGAQAPRRARALLARATPRVTTPARFGIRQAAAYAGDSVALALAVLLVVVSVAVGAAVFVQGRDLAGPSVLGAVASARAWIPQGILAATALAAGITLALTSRRLGLARRREQWAAIRAMGWSRTDVTRAHLAELASSAAPGAVLGMLAAAAVAGQVEGLLVPVLVAAGLAALACLAVVLVAGRRLD